LSIENSEAFSQAVVRALKDARIEQGVSQNELAKRSGVSRPMINHLESGKRNPTLIVVHGLATALGLSVAEVCERVPKTKRPKKRA
jgi:transcriptional regulator with XRE-family HTH domain